MRTFFVFTLLFAAVLQAAFISIQPQTAQVCVGEQAVFQGTLSNFRTSTERFDLALDYAPEFSGYVTTPLDVGAGMEEPFQMAVSANCGISPGTYPVTVNAVSSQGERSQETAYVTIDSCLSVSMRANTPAQSACLGDVKSYSVTVQNRGGRQIVVELSTDSPTPATFTPNHFQLAAYSSKTVTVQLRATLVGTQTVHITTTASQDCSVDTQVTDLTLVGQNCPYATPTPYPYYPTPLPTYVPTPTYAPTATPSYIPTPTPSATSYPPFPTATPVPTPRKEYCLFDWECSSGKCNTPFGECQIFPSPTPRPSATATVTPSPTPRATTTATPTATARPTASPTQTPTATPRPTIQPTVTPTLTVTPSPVPSATPTSTPVPTEQPTVTITPSPGETPVPGFHLSAQVPSPVQVCATKAEFGWKLYNDGLPDSYRLAAASDDLTTQVFPETMWLNSSEGAEVDFQVNGTQYGTFDVKLSAESQATGTVVENRVNVIFKSPQDPACASAPAVHWVEIESAQISEKGATKTVRLNLHNVQDHPADLEISFSPGWTPAQLRLSLAVGQTRQILVSGKEEELTLKVSQSGREGEQELDVAVGEPKDATGRFVQSLSTSGPWVLALILGAIVAYAFFRERSRRKEEDEQRKNASAQSLTEDAVPPVAQESPANTDLEGDAATVLESGNDAEQFKEGLEQSTMQTDETSALESETTDPELEGLVSELEQAAENESSGELERQGDDSGETDATKEETESETDTPTDFADSEKESTDTE